MKLTTFETAFGARHIGALLAGETELVDFTVADARPWFRSMLDLIDGGPEALAAGRSILAAAPNRTAVSAVKILAPLPEPRQMRDCLSFELHVRQARANRYLFGQGTARLDPATVEIPKVWYELPVYYKGNRFTVVGTGVDVPWPRDSKMMDYELEYGIVIGKTGKNIRREDARSHIFGYCIFNDFSARDLQMREMQSQLGPAKGKDFDNGNAIGPWLVTADEVPDPYNLTMIARVNGEEWSRGNSGTMHHKWEDILAHVSNDETLYPGEFLGSGTVGGGCGLELARFLKDGDVVELEVTGLGVLRNRVVVQRA